MAALARHTLYRLTLSGNAPRELAVALPIRWPGDAKRGAAIVAGELRLSGETVQLPADYAAPAAAPADWLSEYHRFAWLADLAALGGAEARSVGRAAVAAWIRQHSDWHPLIWRADILGTRLVAWVTQSEAFLDDADALRDAALASIARQLRHLARVAAFEEVGAARLQALKGLVLASIALDASERRIAKALNALDHELRAQILPDGGHVERSPAVQLSVLRDLVDIRTALRAAHIVVPDSLQHAIDRMAPMLRLFRHGDGRLAQFNDTAEEYGALADLVLTRAEVRGKSAASAPYSGFQRLQGGKTLVIVDTGAPPPHGFDGHAHAGTLSFEMSHGRERLIVNCGAYSGANPQWRRAARNTAAHSTLIVADTNSAEILADGTIGRRPVVVPVDRVEEDGSQWVATSHNGYGQSFALTHSRQLFLAADGDDLRGEDSLTGRAGEGFAIRFHLHPTVQVSLVQDGSAALLRLPSGIGFRLRAEGAQIGLGESVYLGSGDIRKTQQVVLAGHVGTQGATVRWAIRREAKKAPDAVRSASLMPDS
ncbi:MAG: hypothetical protein JWL84_4105 [Rhodospirillales bacterium]|nr:hypothetical protein [Rhodospirillales bacterium]